MSLRGPSPAAAEISTDATVDIVPVCDNLGHPLFWGNHKELEAVVVADTNIHAFSPASSREAVGMRLKSCFLHHSPKSKVVLVKTTNGCEPPKSFTIQADANKSRSWLHQGGYVETTKHTGVKPHFPPQPLEY